MGAVITSRRERSACLADPRAYAGRVGLAAADVDAFAAMVPDLAALTDSFVNKRQGILRRALPHTFVLLGAPARALLADYTAGTPQTEALSDDPLGFGAALLQLAVDSAATVEAGPAIAELAAFELALCRAFWQPAALELVPERSSARTAPEGFDRNRLLQLHPSVDVRHFDHDLRQLRSYTVTELSGLPPDPCHLLFFQNGQRRDPTILRLFPAVAAALARLREQGPQSAAELCSGVDQPGRILVTLARLQSQGVLEWA